MVSQSQTAKDALSKVTYQDSTELAYTQARINYETGATSNMLINEIKSKCQLDPVFVGSTYINSGNNLLVIKTKEGYVYSVSNNGVNSKNDLSSLNTLNGSITITSTGYKQGADVVETPFNGSYFIYSDNPNVSLGSIITISSGVQNIILNDINISTTTSSVFSIASGAEVTLNLVGKNTMLSNFAAAACLQLPSGAKLTINSDSDGELIVTNNETSYAAGIGGNSYQACGSLTINSGKITVYSAAYSGAGIGGGYAGGAGTIVINGGTVSSTARVGGAGIGSGAVSSGGTVTINGGTVTARSNYSGAGIGGGESNAINSVTINGGIITASSNVYGSGIGGGINANGGNITINGGKITASSGTRGAGIGGGGNDGNATGSGGGTILITGGDITATGAPKAAGIGGAGSNSGTGGATGNITITGGTIKATGGNTGIGFGTGGLSGSAGTITVTGGSINAATNQSILDSSSNVLSLTNVTMGTISSQTRVTGLSITNVPSYGINDLLTDTTGKIYLWLKSAGIVTQATTSTNTYSNSPGINAGSSGTLN